MKYSVDDVVILDDNKKYYLIDKNDLNGETYYYAVEYTDDIESLFDNEKCFFKDDNGYLVDVVDLDIIKKLYELFLDKFEDTIKG